MTISTIKKSAMPVFLSLLFMLALTVQSCKKKSRSDLGAALFKKTQNKVFKDATPEGLTEVFKQVLETNKGKMDNPKLITAFYEKNDYDPVFVMDHIFNGDVDITANYFEKASQHGLDPKMFKAEHIKQLVAKFKDKIGIKTIDEAYQDIAELEILMANSLITYSSALQFGMISPRKIYSRYFTATKRPDSISMMQALNAENLRTYLDSIQPKDPQYLMLQKALIAGGTAQGMTKEETTRYLAVNMERLRWKNKPSQAKYIIVNIPDYRLDVMDNGASILNMKVVVGEGRNTDNTNTLIEYNDSDKIDRPFSRETPQLNSMIHSVQVNPVWNIPQSIASKEIMMEAAQDPYYLSNKGIDVYENGKKVEDPETIKWESVSKDKYEFKQRPSDDNSLGKIKFLFNNNSSVYLHDTPAKSGFTKTMRALSHGCVRLSDPQALAKVVFGEGATYEKIAKAMSEDNPEPTTISVPKKMPVYITYVTCWADSTNTLQYRPDVYGLDIVLYAHLQKFLANTGQIAAL
ncbi:MULTISPECIES: L,D-transpeptidase family protein [unclassified Mucilaginibacter]|uniref:L,D-transpeptidase family protein n=3 Tax=Mucilaginibacter TaxID=423349 RepID=UPI002AC956C2|nr:MULTISPECIES: L,D-transpeptidase family protein [unclassified Mucilaginibacter]MEB0277223.1 L,D-transpeptidase family protein [Mucilaginibacter sp. 10B2]MEB0300843.1 L,D-transpeptidase family protein [Mucilaginibacter sp. 5C4]WPX25291.1 L,D-transpeptidase family protein [Mucilaginibacter sp. 5C4]